MAFDHLDFARDREAGVELSFAVSNRFDWFDVRVHWTFIIQ